SCRPCEGSRRVPPAGARRRKRGVHARASSNAASSLRSTGGEERATVTLESAAGRRGERLEKGEVVRGRRDRDVAHRGREDRQLRLNVYAVLVPAEQSVNGVAVPQIVDAWEATVGGADACLA